MLDNTKAIQERAQLLFKALSRWDYESGAGPGHPGLAAKGERPAALPLTNAELVRVGFGGRSARS